MKYIKTYENIRTKRSNLILKDLSLNKIYLYQYSEWDEKDNDEYYCFIVGKIYQHESGIIIKGYHINDKYEPNEYHDLIRGNWFPSLYEANEEEIKKYYFYLDVKNYNV